MIPLSRVLSRVFLLAAAASLAAILSVAAKAQGFPDPSDEAKLYAAAKNEGALVWYEASPLEAAQSISVQFEKKYPGVSVQSIPLAASAQYQRFVQETDANQYIADVIDQSDYPSVSDLVNRGYLAAWKVPTYDRIPPSMRIAINAYTPYSADNVIIYNTNHVTPEEVKLLSGDWKAILDPRFKNRIAITVQRCSACYASVHMFLDPKFKDRYGVPFLKALAAQKPTIYNDITVVVNQVASGEKDFGLWPTESLSFTKFAQGAPAPAVAGSGARGEWQGVSQHTPYPNAARLFLNWMMSDDGAIAFQKTFGAVTNLTGVADQRPVTKEPWYEPIPEVYNPDMQRWARDYTKDMDLWEQILRAAQ